MKSYFRFRPPYRQNPLYNHHILHLHQIRTRLEIRLSKMRNLFRLRHLRKHLHRHLAHKLQILRLNLSKTLTLRLGHRSLQALREVGSLCRHHRHNCCSDRG